MTDKFQNKYRISSARLKNWDYRSDGAYFITICTHNREKYFGHVTNGKMILSNMGVVAYILWQEIINHTPNVELGEFVVMPNHIHGILILNGINDPMGGTGKSVAALEALHATPLTLPAPTENEFLSNISPKRGCGINHYPWV